MQALRTRFPNGEVHFFAVNFLEPLSVVEDYLADTGVRVPVLLDNPAEAMSGCYQIPGGSQNLTDHYQLQVGNPDIDPPFPLQVIIDQDGNFAHLTRAHDTEALISVLNALLER